MKKSRSRSMASIEFARLQRRMSDESVLIVWHWIRNRHCFKQKFRREHPIAPYTVDFCCVELRLVIEIDGAHHWTPEGIEHDQIRDRFLISLGYQVLRIPGFEILRDPPAVQLRIREFIKAALDRLRESSGGSDSGAL